MIKHKSILKYDQLPVLCGYVHPDMTSSSYS
nr:MAG TPA: hypothetical protein [Caudoviricetes sp.]DAL04566.1 MAG TPA: hypothetical protein [Caudoviricetes sp.]DAL12614.1 MAG TPA_asm: hypothetical protein [Caudoviricetes sp.]DAS78967.1 MAG TPA: hypothetical protein [Caudoviricetes sp.]